MPVLWFFNKIIRKCVEKDRAKNQQGQKDDVLWMYRSKLVKSKKKGGHQENIQLRGPEIHVTNASNIINEFRRQFSM